MYPVSVVVHMAQITIYIIHLCVYCLQVVLVYSIIYVRASSLLISAVAHAAQITERAGPLPYALYV